MNEYAMQNLNRKKKPIKERGTRFGVKLTEMRNVGKGETHWSPKGYNYLPLLNKVKSKVIMFDYVRLGKHRN